MGEDAAKMEEEAIQKTAEELEAEEIRKAIERSKVDGD